jgi:DNA-binding NarL/FixJ family response regulator
MLPVKTALIYDDRPAARSLLTRSLTVGMAIDVVSSVCSANHIAGAYTRRPADVVLIGVRRGATAGSDALADLLGLHPAAAVLVYGDSRDIEVLTAAVTRGALGLMLWDPVRPRLIAPGSHPRADHDRPRRAAVSHRELQVLQGISDGKSHDSIGREMYLSADAIKSHARHLYLKLGARDRAHAVIIGLRLDLIS